jgi:hypothetical protein
MIEQNAQRKTSLNQVFLVILFVALYSGEVFFSLYANFQSSADNSYRDENDAVSEWEKSAGTISRRNSIASQVRLLEESIAVKQRQNDMALDGGRIEARLYDEKIRADITIIQQMRAEQRNWEETQLAVIRAPFIEKRQRASENSKLGLLTGISFGFLAPLLSIGMAYLASRQRDNWRWIIFGMAFVAQAAACLLTYKGASLKFGDATLAYAFAVMFFVCAPTAYHFGVIDFSQLNFNRARMMITTTKTVQQRQSFMLWNVDADGWRKAIARLAKEHSAGKSEGLLSQIARDFGVSKNTISRARDRILAGNELIIPKKFRLSENIENIKILERNGKNSTVPLNNGAQWKSAIQAHHDFQEFVKNSTS